MSAHPSFRDLDRVSLGEDLPSVRGHVSICDDCAAYLAQTADVAWSGLPPITEPPRRRLRLFASGGARPAARPRRLALVGIPGLAAAVAAVWITVLPRDEAPQPWLAAKGAPSIAIFVKRDASLSLWDGADPFLPGDRIRLRIAPQEYTHAAVAVFDRSTPGWSVLYEGELRGSEVLLPGSWELDAAPGSERLLVALDARPVKLERAPWRREILLPKAAPAP